MKKRMLCILLCLAMLASVLTLTASAASVTVYTVSYDTAVYYGGTYDIVVGASGTNPFNDVSGGQWYTDAVIWAAENSIVNGVGNGKFEPNTNITREQLATILCRYAVYHGDYNEEDGVMLVTFADQDKISDWAGGAMSWAVGVGLIGGSGEKDGLYLQPGGNALRCQVAAVFHRFCVSFKES